MWEENVRRVIPYVAGEQPKDKNVIKLNTNECPYPPAPGVEQAAKEMDVDSLRLYPDTESTALTEALASYYGVDPDQVFVGVGSDDVLSMCFLTFFDGKEPVLFPDITYSFYDVWAKLYRIPFRTVPLKEDWTLDVEGFKAPNGGIIFPNPNAPTAVYEDLSVVEEILQANPDSIVIVDEAYIDFGGSSALPLLKKYSNLLVVQTFSKSRSMAGLRIGFCIGSKEMIKCLNDVKFSVNSYTMNMPSQALGVIAVEDDAYFRETTGKIIRTRERVKEELAAIGFSFTDSKTNFLFATHRSVPAKEIFTYLRERNIYVRFWDKPRIGNRLRITIGTDAQMDTLIETLKGMPGIC
ncbi:MAG: histidinol-phosphate transaminase [Lachnospiraceae bacterium]|nr:histidinol-phosphate transaminase [Lachnospiraceae bacterium]